MPLGPFRAVVEVEVSGSSRGLSEKVMEVFRRVVTWLATGKVTPGS